MRDDLERQISHNKKKLKRYNSQCKVIDYFNMLLGSVSVLSGSAAAVSTLPVITAPIAIPLGAVGATCGLLSTVTGALSRNRRQKLKHLHEKQTNEKTVQNAIIRYISKAIEDKFISEDEFKNIQDLYEQRLRLNLNAIDEMSHLRNDLENVFKQHVLKLQKKN